MNEKRLMYQAYAVAYIRTPTRLSGRRYHANSPTPAKPPPITRSSAIHRPRSDAVSLVAIRGTSAKPTIAAAAASAQSCPRLSLMPADCSTRLPGPVRVG